MPQFVRYECRINSSIRDDSYKVINEEKFPDKETKVEKIYFQKKHIKIALKHVLCLNF